MIVSVDRCERGQGDLSASDEIEKDLDLTIYPLVTIHEVIEYLSKPNQKGFSLSSELIARMNAYLEEFGA